jgi:hypothetical protein
MNTLLRRISQHLLCLPWRSVPLDPLRQQPQQRQQPHRLLRRQHGFALGQALVSTAMLGAAGAVGTDWAAQQRQTAVLEAQNAI